MYSPDIVLLQEIKCESTTFPSEVFEDLGYNVKVYGQKTFNGVAILSKFPFEDIIFKDFNGAIGESRYIEGHFNIQGHFLRIASIYVPNGGMSERHMQNKLIFLDQLYTYLQSIIMNNENIVVGGDFNVAPTMQDVYDPMELSNSCCFTPEERQKIYSILNLGFKDIWRMLHPNEKTFSWWDYRGGGFQKNHGMRLDYILCPQAIIESVAHAEMCIEARKWEKPSDHIPVLCTFSNYAQ